VQATTGSGGWPLSVFLTPGLKPVYGGTYFPPAPTYGRPAFTQILEALAKQWRDDPVRYNFLAWGSVANPDPGFGTF
jgi:uncharacterized protein YyaL (SSP411 family)